MRIVPNSAIDFGFERHEATISSQMQQGRSKYVEYTESNPGYFEDFHPNFGPIAWHMLNHSDWCYTQADIPRFLANMPKQGGRRRRWWILLTGETIHA